MRFLDNLPTLLSISTHLAFCRFGYGQWISPNLIQDLATYGAFTLDVKVSVE